MRKNARIHHAHTLARSTGTTGIKMGLITQLLNALQQSVDARPPCFVHFMRKMQMQKMAHCCGYFIPLLTITFYAYKMNALHIASQTGWSRIAFINLIFYFELMSCCDMFSC